MIVAVGQPEAGVLQLLVELRDPRDWSEALVTKVEDEIRQTIPEAALPPRRAWRDRCLAALVVAKTRVFAANAG